MRRIILLAVSSIFILSACGNNQSVITEAKVEETTKETIIETTVEETTTIQETKKEIDKVQELADRINGIKKGEFTNEMLQEYGINDKEEFFSKLAEKGLYCFFDDSATEKYDWDNYIIKVVNKEEITELLQKYVERTMCEAEKDESIGMQKVESLDQIQYIDKSAREIAQAV